MTTLTPIGAHLLQRRIDHMHDLQAELGPHIAGEDPDPAAREEWERLAVEIGSLQCALNEADVRIPAPERFDGRVELGMRVLVEGPDGAREWVRPVDPLEAWLDAERISAHSPLSRALLGARRGHRVWVAAPTGVWEATVVDIDPEPDFPALP